MYLLNTQMVPGEYYGVVDIHYSEDGVELNTWTRLTKEEYESYIPANDVLASGRTAFRRLEDMLPFIHAIQTIFNIMEVSPGIVKSDTNVFAQYVEDDSTLQNHNRADLYSFKVIREITADEFNQYLREHQEELRRSAMDREDLFTITTLDNLITNPLIFEDWE